MRFAHIVFASIVATAGGAAAALNVADLDKLTVYDKAWDDSAEDKAPEAREAFAGRAGDVVEHFLRAHRGRPRTGAYAFVLRAVGDVDSTLVLIGALREPPRPEEGATVRQPAEIAALVGTIVDVPAVGGDPRVAAALDALANAPPETKNHDVVVAAGVALLGRSRGPDAVRALLARAENEKASMRSIAVQALGWMGDRIGAGERPLVFAAMTKRLESDEEPEVRARAADALRHLELREGTDALRTALERETEPTTVDAIVEAMEALGAPVTEPARCREIAGRGFDAHRMRAPFECWRKTASRDDLVDAATRGPPILRALALRALVVDPAPPEGGTPMGEAPPPPTGPVEGIDEATSERLLASAVDVLGQEGSLGMHDEAIAAAWGLGRGNLSLILPATDEIASLPLRYFASWSLHRWSPAGYDHYRREREIWGAVWLALPFFLIAFGKPAARPYAALGLFAVAGWGVTTYLARGTLDLPPWPYPLAKVRFLVPVAATLTASLALRLPHRRRLVCLLAGPLSFLVLYGATRASGFFPPDTLDGMLFLVEPALGVSMTGPIAFLLAWIGGKVAAD